MSLSSETTKLDLKPLNYARGRMFSNYYAAQPLPGVGVVVIQHATWHGIQFFPWAESDHRLGNEVYAEWVVFKANETLSDGSSKYRLWRNFHVDGGNNTDLLTIKCLIEDGLNKIKEKLHGDDQAQRADAPTRQDVV